MANNTSNKLTVVQETNKGVYVWLTENNEVIKNENGDYLSVASEEHDLVKIGMLRNAARYYGIEGGRPFFLPGRRKITDEEYEEQKARLAAGLTPDPYDAAALRDDIRARKNS